MAFICGGLKILKFCSGAQVQGIFRPRRSGFKGLSPMANLSFLACLILSVIYTRLMRPNKVETGHGLLT